MDDLISTSVDKKNTNSALPTFTQQPAKDEDALHAGSGLLSQTTQKSGRSTGRKPWLDFFRGYGTALFMSLPLVPIVASAITIVIYLSNPPDSGGVSVISGAISTCIAWLLVSLLLVPLTSPRNVNSHSFSILESRVRKLKTCLNVLSNEYPFDSEDSRYQMLPEYQRVALHEVFDKLQEITEDLYESNTRLPWVLGYGYVNVWRRLHRAEEALVEVEPLEMMIRGAIHDNMAISHSKINNRNQLLTRLQLAVPYAVKKADPTMVNLLKRLTGAFPSSEENESPELQDVQQVMQLLQQDVQQMAHNQRVNLKDYRGSSQSSRSMHDSGDSARARYLLREVRQTINEYRDHLWEGVMRTRNNLLGVTFVAGLGTHILLCIAILALSPTNPDSRTTIIAAASYYMMGALAGLFGRIRQATLSNIAVDDYGLALAQIISRPIYSGLAGLGGVLISSTVFSISTQNGVNAIQNVFTPLRLDFLIVAAAFGLTPNLIASGLQNQTNKLLEGLHSSKAAAIDTNANNEMEQSSWD